MFTAMDDSFVEIRGTVPIPGEIRLSFDTGCRPGPPPSSGSPEPGEARSVVSSVLDVFGMADGATNWTAAAAPCGAGRQLRTVRAVAAGGVPDLAVAVRESAGAGIVAHAQNLLAYRIGGTGIVVAGGTRQIVVSATTVCLR